MSERGPIRDLPEEAALSLAKKWESSQNPYSHAWSHFVDHQRPLLMELACYPDSVLGTEVEKQVGKDHIIRLSHWNGADLETREGVSLAKTMLRRLRPRNLWISCECGPFSPLQRINQRSPEQRERLQEKQYRAMLQYTGAIEVANLAFKLHTEVHWELSQRCEAWELAEIQTFLSKHRMNFHPSARSPLRSQRAPFASITDTQGVSKAKRPKHKSSR